VRAHVIGSGPTVVLLHGQPGSSRDWRRVVRRLRRDRRVVAVDRPGYGAASHEQPSGFAGNADQLARLLAGHGVTQATVVGHSWGGGAAIAFAERHPEMVSALVLVGAVGAQESVGPLDAVLAWPVIGPLLSLWFFRWLAPRVVSPWVLRTASSLAADQAAQVADEVRQWRRRPVWRSFLREQRALLDEMPALSAGLGSITVPTRVVVGSKDRVVSPAACRELVAAIPSGVLYEVPDCGHLLPLEAPDQLAQIIRAASAPTEDEVIPHTA
jgi:pimeloyl-ACP methyl ester carboxylesterase